MTRKFIDGARTSHVLVEDSNATWCGLTLTAVVRDKPSHRVCFRCREAIKLGLPYVVIADNPNATCPFSGRKVARTRQQIGDHKCPGCGNDVPWESGVILNNWSYVSHKKIMVNAEQVGTKLVEDVPAPF